MFGRRGSEAGDADWRNLTRKSGTSRESMKALSSMNSGVERNLVWMDGVGRASRSERK